MTRLLSLLTLALCSVLAVSYVEAQDDSDAAEAPKQQEPAPKVGDTTSDGLTREQMWRAPTAEDWAKPCLIPWERTWEDAFAVAQETGKPLLICVNMDGEIASEHYAGIRYRQPEIAELYEPYVCVIASVYRHTPRDHDHEGNRIPCPRFGHVTCGEHIAIEPILYEKYFEGTRVAPRHIMIEHDKSEQYDLYYAFDTQTVFETVHEGVVSRDNPIPPIVRSDRPIEDRVASRANEDRTAVEKAYRTGTTEVRKKLLRKAVEAGDKASVDLLRMAILGFDVELAQLGRDGLIRSESEAAIDLLTEALRVPLPAGERARLVAALERLGERYPRAKTLAKVHQGLSADSTLVDKGAWKGKSYSAQPVERAAIESAVEYSSVSAASKPDDASAQLELAEATLAMAVDPRSTGGMLMDTRTAQRYGNLLFEDARQAALRAEKLGASGWRLDAALGLCAWYLGEGEEGYRRAEAAVKALPAGEESWNAMAVLSLFADRRRTQISEAIGSRQEWDGAWLTDLHAAYSVLARHPYGTADQVVGPIDFLNSLQAYGQASELIQLGLERFPDAPALHDRLRARILRERGAAGLEPVYDRLLAQEGASPNLPWFSGYTSIIAAEFHRRENQPAKALLSYDRAIAHFDLFLEQSEKAHDSANHYAALALAGQSRVHAQQNRLTEALDKLLASFDRHQEAAASTDGLNIHPVATAELLIARFRSEERTADLEKLQARLAEMPARLLQRPEWDRGGAPSPDVRRRRRGR